MPAERSTRRIIYANFKIYFLKSAAHISDRLVIHLSHAPWRRKP